MSYQIIQPVNQVRLTNVAVVRLSRGGHRFEVACYRNKIVNYRQGTETDLSEVLQTERVFTNVSKGQFANSATLRKCFDTAEERAVCRFILDKGDVQVSDQERAARHEATAREVAGLVAAKCVDAASRRPYTPAQIRDAMKGAGFMVHPTRNVKQQFLECVKLLRKQGALNIERAKMQVAVVLGVEEDEENEEEDGGSDSGGRRSRAVQLLMEEGVARSDILPPHDIHDSRIVFQLDPSLYRKVEGIARNPAVQGRLEIIQQCVTEEGEVTLGTELERRAQHQQQQQDTTNNAEARQKASMADDGVEQLAHQMHADLTVKENALPVDGDPADGERPAPHAADPPVATSRKAQKAAQKKSKKAQRRAKEERAEREERRAAEQTRQRARAARLGLEDPGEGRDGAAAAGARPADGGGGGGGTAAAKACNTCGGAFAPGEYRAHFRSDWHRYNVKLKMQNVASVSEKEFVLCDSEICLF